MTCTDKSFLIRCNSEISRRLTYAIYKAAWNNNLKYAMVGTSVATTNASFRLYAVVKINATSNPARVSTLLHLPNSATVVPTNVDFSTYHISINFIRLLAYGSLDDSTIKSESTSTLTSDYIIDSDDSSSEHVVEAVVELPNFKVVGGPNNEANEMRLFNNTLRDATEAQLKSYRRTKRNLDRTSGQVETLPEDSFALFANLKLLQEIIG
eukprot:CAMPEP_0172415830 /NCGR_PEP_ID=MMETSP1064-20121228/2263_1 /TAXON_ID=202472 /ORGANISM="Aulacoseira subarctica , Strain CCAP 1002/5" /LENGTH=209 /DNA_ID=CAMNT_0013153073 /DNA_START=48 /DNA_END=678 /DNA_ORIENTATION=-